MATPPQITSSRPSVFFCSSYLSRESALALELALDRIGYAVTHWKDAFSTEMSTHYSEVVTRRVQQADFVIVILTPDATQTVESADNRESYRVPSGNVIFELGLAWGILGPNRVIMLRLKNRDQEPRLPSDLSGITSVDDFSIDDLKDGSGLQRVASALDTVMVRKRETVRQQRLDAVVPWLSLINCKFGMQEELLAKLQVLSKGSREKWGVDIIETGVVWGPFDNFLLYTAPDVRAFVDFVTELRRGHSGLIRGVDSRMIFPQRFWRDSFDETEESRIRPFRHLVLLSCPPNTVETVFTKIQEVAKDDGNDTSKVNITTVGILTGESDLFFISSSSTVESHHHMIRDRFHRAVRRDMAEWGDFTNTTSLLVTKNAKQN